MKNFFIIILFSVLLAVNKVRILYASDSGSQLTSPTTAPVNSQTNLVTQAPKITTKPKIIIKDSGELCKKYLCDMENLQIDCSRKAMNTLFSASDWETLQNGDVFFKIIKMDHNEISSIPLLPEYPIESLYLSYNKISDISVGAFQNLSQLTVLDLSNNQLTPKSLNPHVFKGKYVPGKYEPLLKLRTLNLSNNKIYTLHRDVFEHLPNMETLILSSNPFHVIDESTTIAIASLSLLKTLELSYTELNGLPNTIFNPTAELETLILTGNLFKTLPDALSRAIHLKKLILDDIPLSDIVNANFSVFKSLGELEFLSISYLQDVSKIGPGVFSELQNLTTLVATNNPHLTHIHKLAFTKNTSNPNIFNYPPLKKLYLQNNNLTTFERDWIERWEKITELDLRFNPWACDCTNNWLIHSIMKQINNTTPRLTHDVTCQTPSAWKQKLLLDLSDNKVDFSCENASNTENKSFIFVSILVGILIGIPLTLGGLAIYRKYCYIGLLNWRNPPADRSLYNRTTFDDEFHI